MKNGVCIPQRYVDPWEKDAWISSKKGAWTSGKYAWVSHQSGKGEV